MSTESPEVSSQFFDFDAWHAAQHGATIPFKLLDEVWQLPGDCPAALLLKHQRIEQWFVQTSLLGEDAPLPDGLTADDILAFSPEKMARDFVGDTIVDAWFEKGIPAEMFRAVAKRLFAIYSRRDPDAAIGLGKAPAPKAPQDRKPRTSKKAGGRSSSGS